ncbi:MAG: hypothetical protein V4677_17780 [Bacteroidota bacterium]
MNNTASEIDLPYVTISYSEPIVRLVYKEGAELGFPEIKELITHAEKLSGHKPYVTLNYVKVNINITNEGKRYVANTDNMPLFRGTAAIVKNSFYQFAANFAKGYHSTKYPFKAFTSEDKAIAWLMSLPLEK